MSATSNTVRGGGLMPRRCLLAMTICVAACGAQAGRCAAAAPAQRFVGSGNAQVTLVASAQRGGEFVLRGTLADSDAALKASPPVQESAGYALIAKLAPKPSVCSNDTIFRNDFDGDGF